MRLRFVFSELGIGLRRNVLMMFSVVVITAFSLLCLGAALLIHTQVNMMKHYWYQRLQISVYLCADHSTNPNCPTAATQQEIDNVQTTLNGLRPLVTDVAFVNQQQAYDIFKAEFKDAPELVKNTSPNALPESFTVKLSDPHKFQVVTDAVSGKAGVDEVQDEHQIYNKLFHAMHQISNFVIILGIVIILAAIVMIAIAVQVSASSRRREIGIMKLVGASNLYIQTPFVLEGVLAGLAGGVLGLAGLAAFKYFIVDDVLRPILRSLGALVEWGDVLGTAPITLAVGVVIAACASFVTFQLYLRRI